jgi:hypothetical protein
MKIILFTLILILSFECTADTNYCKDEEARVKWEKMLVEYPNDDMVLHLAGLHYGMCMMIDKGQISRDKAIDIFESAKGGAVQSRFTEQVLNKKNTDDEI